MAAKPAQSFPERLAFGICLALLLEAAFFTTQAITTMLVNSMEQPEQVVDVGSVIAIGIGIGIVSLPTLMYLLGTIAPLRIRPLLVVIGSLCSSALALLFAVGLAARFPTENGFMPSVVFTGAVPTILFNLLLGGAACIALRAAARSTPTPTQSNSHGDRIAPAALGFCLAILARVVLDLAGDSIAATLPDSSVPIARILTGLIGLLLISLVILVPGRIKPVFAVLFGLLGAGYALSDILLMMSEYHFSFIDGFLSLGRFWSILAPLAFGGVATLLLRDRTHDRQAVPPSPATGDTGAHEMPARHSTPSPLSTGTTA